MQSRSPDFDHEGIPMHDAACPKCGHATATDTACPDCGHAVRDGMTQPTRHRPSAPPEVANWVIHPTPPEVLEQLRQTFDEAEFMAELREIEQTGGVRFEDIIDEVERKTSGSD